MTVLLRRVLPLLVLALLAVPTSAAASSTGFTAGEATQALADAEATLNAPQTLSGGVSAETPDATLALRDLAVALPALNGADRERAKELLRRPTDKNDRNYFGKEAAASPICNAQFCIHWTEEAKNAPVNQEFIGEVGAALDQSYAVENGSLGWVDPKSDGTRGARNGVGGDGQTDAYITNLGRGLYGFAAPDPGQDGPKRSSYLVLDNNYVGFPTPPIQSMQVTAAHEYNHVLQFSYDIFEQLWMLESSATWVEDYVFPEINDYLGYVATFAKEPNVPLTTDEFKVYGDAVWNHWLAARYTPDVIRQSWAGSLSTNPKSFAPAAYEKAIKANGGGSFGKEFGNFAASTAEWRSAPLVYPDAAQYPDMKRKGTIGAGTKKLTLDNTSYRLFKVNAGGAKAKLKVKAPKGVQSAIALVGRVGPAEAGTVTIRSRFLNKGGKGTVELESPGSFDRVTALVINADARKKTRYGYASDGSQYKASLKG